MSQKKILHIVEAFGGGIFSFLVDLVKNTSDEFEITIAYAKRNQTPKDFEKYFDDKVKFIEIKNFTRNINWKKDWKAFFEVKKLIQKVKPDCVHLHSSKAGFIGRFAANGKKMKLLYNPPGFAFLMKNDSPMKRAFYWGIEKIAAFRNCTIIGCSQGEYQEALSLRKNSICINNGIDLESMEQQISNLKQRQIDFSNLKICTSGRIGYQKNPELFNQIAKDFPDIQFTWIGDGELKHKLTSENIVITGWKTRQEVLEIVNQNDIFLLTSLWEGLPIALLEAMYLGKICVVSDCIGNKDVIQNGKNGFVMKNNHYKQIIQNLNLETYQQITQKAKEDVLREFNTEKMAQKYRGVYNS